MVLSFSEKRRMKLRRRHIILEEQQEEKEEEPPWFPPNWIVQWNNLLTMRTPFNAPVDIMEYYTFSDKCDNPSTFRYQILISLMLSTQTKDETTSVVMAKLKQYGCDVDRILATKLEKLQSLIYPVGFYKIKAKSILMVTAILKAGYGGDIPKTVEELCRLPGVGPKIAHLVMKYAWNEVTGIAVDCHVHKVCNRLGWTKTETMSPAQTQSQIESWIPRKLWSDINVLLAGFGQQVCHKRKPNCESCLNSATCLFKLGLRK